MDKKTLIRGLQQALNGAGENLVVDGDLGPKTEAAMAKYKISVSFELEKRDPAAAPPINPAYVEAKKYAGKSEYDKSWSDWLSKFWGKVGLPGWKTIVGTSAAWCGLFVAAMNLETGQKIISGAAGARNWAKYGVEVDWKKNGIPRGAVIHINHASNCSSGSGNHVMFADGDCSAADMAKPGATVPGFGGNQADQVKRSNFPANDICEVRWPSEIPLPGPVSESSNCAGKPDKDSTR